jgi:DNA-binding NarL/FixJ family response regulator
VTIRILIVDDDTLIRTGLRMILDSQEDFEVVGEAGDGEVAIQQAHALRPDVVLMDVQMPRLDGLHATAAITGEDRNDQTVPRVIILTTFELDEYVFKALRSGASGFVLKRTPAEELISAVRTVAAGEALLAPSVTRKLIEAFAARPAPQQPDRALLGDLTAREIEIWRHIARGMSNAEIAQSLYLSTLTVKTHVTNLLSKLNLRDRTQAVVLAYESGLITPGAPEAPPSSN